MSSQFHLLGERRFRPFFVVSFLGAFNDNAFKTAFVTLVTFRAGQLTRMDPRTLATLLPGLFILPFFLFSATSGQIADKLEKSLLTRWVKLFEIAVMLLAAWGFLASLLWPLLGALILMGVHSTLFGPVKYAYLPQHLAQSELVGGNGMMEMGTFVAILLGEVLGAALAAMPGGGLVTSVTLVGIAVLGYLASRGVPHSPAADPGLRVNWNIALETWRNLRFARTNRVVWLSLMGISWFWFFGATLLAQFPAYSREVLGGDATVFILLLTLFSFGIGLGSLLCERLSGRRVELGLVPLGALGLTLFGADLALASPVHTAGAMHFTAFLAMAAHWRLMADIVLTGLFGGFFIVPLYALIQTRADKSRQSRIIAANNILNALFMVVSAVVSMLLFRAGCSIPQLFLATALFNAVVAAWLMALVPEFLARFLSWTLVRTFCRLEREHLERIPEEGAALLVSNRVSAVDVLLILAASPRPIRFVLERRLFAVPVLGFLLRRMRAIPADAGRAEFDRAFREGDLVAIFPEGRRTPDGAPGEFDAGLVERVERARVPVLPIGLGGSAGRRAGALPARVSLRVGAPLGPEGLPGSLRAGIQALM